MNIEDLQKYCADDTSRTEITKPFTRGEYTYATNGHILIRVPRLPEVTNTSSVDIGRLSFNGEVYFPIPDVDPPKYIPCKECGGSGVIKTCPECDGEGEVVFDNCYNEYSCECKTCDGTGKLPSDNKNNEKCNRCSGTGKVIERENVIVAGRKYDKEYIAMLRDLPNCVLAHANGLTPGHFKFDGGDGLLMPLNL